MNSKSKNSVTCLPIPTPDGEFVAHYSMQGLAGLRFPSAHKRNKSSIAIKTPVSAQVRRWHAVTSKALNEALTGQIPKSLPPLDLSSGTVFQQRVWNALRRIASGKTRSYTEIATAIGQRPAARAVGSACGANPIPVFVPCHRVLAANLRLGGFSGGLDWKRKLLAREGIHFSKQT
jgi:methylated-DNA-[protein]-cysteine S-methyltransferase